jgi:A/G-specific adenine glycosylase
VLRVVARVTNDAGDISAGRTRERFREIAQQWLDPREPGHFNQALMELGATVCLPRNPLCLVCPLAACCRARQEGTAAQLPVKLRKTEPVRLSGTLLVVRHRGRILLRQRDAATKRMAGFWDLPAPEDLPGAKIGARIGEIRHTITHHHYTLEVRSATARLPAGTASAGSRSHNLRRFPSAPRRARRSIWPGSFTRCDSFVNSPLRSHRVNCAQPVFR